MTLATSKRTSTPRRIAGAAEAARNAAANDRRRRCFDAVTASNGSYWVTETQAYQFIRFAFEPDHPAPILDLPFKIQRVNVQ